MKLIVNVIAVYASIYLFYACYFDMLIAKIAVLNFEIQKYTYSLFGFPTGSKTKVW